MAYRIATADGNLTAAATWSLVDATSLLDSESATQVLATAASWTSSTAFTPGAITIDGIAVKIVSRSATPSGTVSIRLYNVTGGAAVAGTTVTVNVSDVPWDGLTNRSGGWMFFKFAGPVTLLAATQYRVEGQTSAASMVTCDRDGTVGNLARMLRTTTTAAPGAGDSLFVLGEWTAPATVTTRTVTMDNTDATDYGGASTSVASFGVSSGGVLTWATTAATAFRFRLSGLLTVWYGGIYRMGTTGTPCPRDSTMLLEFDNAADGQFGPIVYGTLIAQGQSRTVAKTAWLCHLNTDEAIGQTDLGVDTDTGWLSGDEIGIAPTARTYSQGEERILNADAGAGNIVVTVGLTNAHSGTAPTQAEVVLLTRNVRIESVSTSHMSFFYALHASTVDLDWVGFRYMGTNTVGRRGVEFWTTSGSFTMHNCCIRQFDYCGTVIAHATAADNYTIANNTFWRAAGGPAIYQLANSTGSTWSITGNFVGGVTSYSTYGIQISAYAGTIDDNIITATSAGGFYFNAIAAATGSFDGNTIHTTNSYGINIAQFVWGLRLTNCTVWRNASYGVHFGAAIHAGFISGTFFGNATANFYWSASESFWGTIFRDVISNGDSSFATTSGIDVSGLTADAIDLILENCDFSTAGGIKTAHTQDFKFSSTSKCTCRIQLRNTILAAATEFLNTTSLIGRSYIAKQRADGVTNVHSRVYPALGTVAYEAATFRTAAPSELMTPNGADAHMRLRSSTRMIPVGVGQTATISCYVQKDAGYVGEAVRLIVLANPSLGLDADLVLASMSGGAGAWEQLSGAVAPAAEEDGAYEACVEVTGAAGNVYVDDWAVAYA